MWSTSRFVTAHLESFEEHLGLPIPIFRFAQVTELLLGPTATSLPVVLAGDFNADAENPSDPTYQLLLSSFLDAWEATSPDNPGLTWPLFLRSPFVYTSPTQRLDLVLTRGTITPGKSDLVGLRDATPGLPMPSDHAGLVVTLEAQ